MRGNLCCRKTSSVALLIKGICLDQYEAWERKSGLCQRAVEGLKLSVPSPATWFSGLSAHELELPSTRPYGDQVLLQQYIDLTLENA